jgi:DNA-binding protein H-NS
MDWQSKMDKIYVQVNGEKIEATGEILADILALQEQVKADRAAEAKAVIDKAAILAKIGITADEAKLLLS